MESLVQGLRNCCSQKDKWTLIYFSLALDCNVCVLDSLFHTSFQFVELDKSVDSWVWAIRFGNALMHRLIARLREPVSKTFTQCTWQRGENQLVQSNCPKGFHQREVVIHCFPCENLSGTFLRTSFVISGTTLRFSTGYITTEMHRFKNIAFFEWFVNTCIEETVKLYLK
jgi:hypothetical protein